MHSLPLQVTPEQDAESVPVFTAEPDQGYRPDFGNLGIVQQLQPVASRPFWDDNEDCAGCAYLYRIVAGGWSLHVERGIDRDVGFYPCAQGATLEEALAELDHLVSALGAPTPSVPALAARREVLLCFRLGIERPELVPAAKAQSASRDFGAIFDDAVRALAPSEPLSDMAQMFLEALSSDAFDGPQLDQAHRLTVAGVLGDMAMGLPEGIPELLHWLPGLSSNAAGAALHALLAPEVIERMSERLALCCERASAAHAPGVPAVRYPVVMFLQHLLPRSVSRALAMRLLPPSLR